MKNSIKKSLNIFYVALLIFAPLFLNADNPSKKPICKSIEKCQKLSKSLEKQIGEFKKKGIENLSEDEFMQFYKLKNKLLETRRTITAKQREIIAKQRAKTAKQREILAKQRAKTAEMKAKIAKQREILAEENRKQAKQREIIAKNKKEIKKMLKDIKKTLD